MQRTRRLEATKHDAAPDGQTRLRIQFLAKASHRKVSHMAISLSGNAMVRRAKIHRRLPVRESDEKSMCFFAPEPLPLKLMAMQYFCEAILLRETMQMI